MFVAYGAWLIKLLAEKHKLYIYMYHSEQKTVLTYVCAIQKSFIVPMWHASIRKKP